MLMKAGGLTGPAGAQESSPWRHLAAGAAAGAASRTATAPLETLRLQAMAGCLEAPSLLGGFRATLARGGWPALYKARPP